MAHNMPNDKRRTAIRLFSHAMEMHARAIPHCLPSQVDIHRSKIKNLEKLIVSTQSKL